MDLFPPVKPSILVVDDSPVNLSLVAGLLRDRYLVKAATDGERALSLVRADPPGLILLDLEMPGMDGYEVCRRLKADPMTRPIPVIFLTSHTEVESELRGLALGAADYITRPINPGILMSRVRAHYSEASHAEDMRVANAYLNYEVDRRTRELAAMQDVTILALASLAETRDIDTGNHLRRTQNYVRALANRLRSHPAFSDYLSAAIIDLLFKCAPLHDIGKVGIPDRILLKPGRYEPDEYALMKLHPILGYNAIVRAQLTSAESSQFFDVAKDIVHSHHEKWDGTGYPQGLAGPDIPIPARLVALADVYDALISRRVYKSGISHEQATQVIVEGRGSHFDPDVVDAFLALAQEFQGIAQTFADSESDLAEKTRYIDSAIARL
jgi:putative two-component system response regulator